MLIAIVNVQFATPNGVTSKTKQSALSFAQTAVQICGRVMMKDLIDRREAIDALDRAAECWNIAEPFNEGMRAGYKAAVTIVLSLPSAQPERMRGKWIERNPQNSDKCRLIECDQCGFSHIVGFNVPYEHWIENRNFCERCGADMREEKDGRPD